MLSFGMESTQVGPGVKLENKAVWSGSSFPVKCGFRGGAFGVDHKVIFKTGLESPEVHLYVFCGLTISSPFSILAYRTMQRPTLTSPCT